jgi:hypothetical protein
MFRGRLFPWVLHEVGLDIEESKEKIDVIISGQEMGGNASLPTVINPTVIKSYGDQLYGSERSKSSIRGLFTS